MHEEGKEAHLRVKAQVSSSVPKKALEAISQALGRTRIIQNAVADGSLVLDPITLGVLGPGAGKRKIVDRRGRN